MVASPYVDVCLVGVAKPLWLHRCASTYLDLSDEGVTPLLDDSEVHRQRGLKERIVVVHVRHHNADRGRGGLNARTHTHTKTKCDYSCTTLRFLVAILVHLFSLTGRKLCFKLKGQFFAR